MRVVACVVVWLLLIGSVHAACPTPPGGTNCLVGTPSVATNAALKALTGTMPAYVYRAGYYSVGDGGDALYMWSASASCPDDGGSCIAPTTGTGRWLLRGNTSGTPAGAVSIKVFGAVCDATTDDSIPIRNALAAQSSAFIPANTTCRIWMYSNSDGIPLHTGYHFYGENTGTSQLQVVLNNTTSFPSFDFAASGKLNNIVVEQIPPPQPYNNMGEYSWDVYDTTGGNGSVTVGNTYYIKLAAVDAAGTSQASALWHYVVPTPASGTAAIGIDLPWSVIGDGTGFNVYASTTSGGTYFKQNASPIAGGTTFQFGTAANPFRTTTVNGPSAPSTNTTSVTVGDVTTYWSHMMHRGGSVVISGATPSGLNGTYSIQRITFPDHFIIQTTGVAAGTYSPPTNFPAGTSHLTGPSGLGTAVFYAYNRDSATTGGSGKELINIELDHFTLYDASTNIPLVLFDISATYDARVHDIFVTGPVANSGVITLSCADASPFDNHINGACFFYHVHDMVVGGQLAVHLSVNNYPAPAGPGANAGAGMLDNWQGGLQSVLDITSVGGQGENGGGKFLQGYLSGDNSPLSYDYYPGKPFGSHFELWSCEGCASRGDPNFWGLGGGAQFEMYSNNINTFSIMTPFVLTGPTLPRTVDLPPCGSFSGLFAYYAVGDAPSGVTPYSPVGAGGGTGPGSVRPVFCDGIGPNWTYH